MQGGKTRINWISLGVKREKLKLGGSIGNKQNIIKDLLTI